MTKNAKHVARQIKLEAYLHSLDLHWFGMYSRHFSINFNLFIACFTYHRVNTQNVHCQTYTTKQLYYCPTYDSRTYKGYIEIEILTGTLELFAMCIILILTICKEFIVILIL